MILRKSSSSIIEIERALSAASFPRSRASGTSAAVHAAAIAFNSSTDLFSPAASLQALSATLI